MQASNDDDEEEEDRLLSIHNHLADDHSEDGAPPANNTTWLPLESSPDVFNLYGRQTAALPLGWEFVDVLGFDEDLLSPELVPRPVVGCIFLFPTSERIYGDRASQKKELMASAGNDDDAVMSGIFHIEQVKGFGNACGTIAATHLLLNTGLASPDFLDPFDDSGTASPLHAYRRRADSMSLSDRSQRGRLLVETREVHALSDDTAQNLLYCQTRCPETGHTRLGHHYCSFVPVKNGKTGRIHVIELDGTKISPVDHGPIGVGGDFLLGVVRAIKRDWVFHEPNRIDFSLMALVPKL